ncbi:hypothetical protein KEM52_004494 [Ascosphaera acerosa]|nr:hypothetical protein KEM52_004494 [Ascosphaera acerosa]
MVVPYIATPRTEVGADATYLDTGFRGGRMRNDLTALDSGDDYSFHSPSRAGPLLKLGDPNRNRPQQTQKQKQKQKQTGQSHGFKTPRNAPSSAAKSRIPLQRRHLLQSGPSSQNGEFTPLLNSAVKASHLSRSRSAGALETPAPGPRSQLNFNFSTTPRSDSGGPYGDLSDDTGGYRPPTPMPQPDGTTPQSSPLPQMPDQDGNILGDGQAMTLKEQVKQLDKLEKENFDLKMRVTLLDQQLRNTKPEYREKVHQEVVDLKIEKGQLQRNLVRYKTQLKQANQTVATYQQELQAATAAATAATRSSTSATDSAKQSGIDDGLRRQLQQQDARLQEMVHKLEAAQHEQQERSDEVAQLRDEINDLQYDLRERDRALDARDEKIAQLKDQVSESNVANELQDELERAQGQVDELRTLLQDAKEEADQARRDAQEYRAKFDEEHRRTQTAENDLRQHTQTSAQEKRQLKEMIASLTQQCEGLRRERDDLSHRLRDFDDEAHDRQDAERMWKSRHDALLEESASLQSALAAAKSQVAELQQAMDGERQELDKEMEALRAQSDDDVRRLSDQVAQLQRELDASASQHAAHKDKWESMQRSLEIQKQKAEQQAASYKRTIDKLQGAETALSSKEQRLQNIMDNERQRHKEEEASLERQLQQLNEDIADRRRAADAQRSELLQTREALRASQRDATKLQEKVQALEDEIVVLQSQFEEQQAREAARAAASNGNARVQQQLQAISKEKQLLQKQLADAESEQQSLQAARAEAMRERDELAERMRSMAIAETAHTRNDGEKVGELQRVKCRLEAELARLREERIPLIEDRESLRKMLEEEREKTADGLARLTLKAESLQRELHHANESRERALAAAKAKTDEARRLAEELEDQMARGDPSEANAIAPSSPGTSLLRRHLDEARQREAVLLRREADLKSRFKEVNAQVAELERENHELKTRDLISSSPPASPPSTAAQEEIRDLRKQVLAAQKQVKDLHKEKKELERLRVKEAEREDLHELLKTATLEAETLAVKLAERDARVQELRTHLKRVRDERRAVASQMQEMQDSMEQLEQQYQDALDELQDTGSRKAKHVKEIRGLGKEIRWLRARYLREKRFREDLAWSKGLMELGERVRAACNETDLQMIAAMGVPIPPAETESEGASERERERRATRDRRARARRKFRAVAWACVAVSRMQKARAEWRQALAVGDGLRRAKLEAARRRDGASARGRKGYAA